MNKLEFLFRWTHVFAGIIWIGHLYFFNFVNIQLQGKMDDPTKKLVNPQLMPRALWWFRWGAMVTFLSGLALFAMIYFYTPGIGWGANMILKGVERGHSDRARWLEWGMLFGSIMWFNVWFVIWPAQKKLLGGTAGDAAPALEPPRGADGRGVEQHHAVCQLKFEDRLNGLRDERFGKLHDHHRP